MKGKNRVRKATKLVIGVYILFYLVK